MAVTLQKLFSLFRVNTALTDLYDANIYEVLSMDSRGAVFVQNVINGTASANLMMAVTDNTDNQATTPLVAGSPAPQAVVSRLYGYDSAGNNWDRLRVAGNNADAVAVETIGVLKQAAALYGFNGATFDRLLSQANNGDAVAVSTLGLIKQAAFNYLFNGTTFDRERGNEEGTALASAVRAVTTDSADIINYNGRGVVGFLNVTAVPGVSSVNARFQIRDPASGTYVDAPRGVNDGIFSPQTVTTVATGIFLFQYGNPFDSSNVSNVVPRTFRIRVTQTGAGNFTYSVGFSITR